MKALLHAPITHRPAVLPRARLAQAWAADAVKIMPLGCSFSQGNTKMDSYRRPLWHKLVDAGYHVDFVGSQPTNFTGHAPHPDFDEDNEGHFGWDTFQDLPQLDGWLDHNKPDIVLLLLGTNHDQEAGAEVALLANLEQMIVKIRAHNPKATVLLSTLINNWASNVVANQRMPELAKKLTTPESQVILVDNAAGFVYPDDSIDGCHPNPQGEEKMAVKWFEALKSVLPKPEAAGKTPTKTVTKIVD